MQICFTSSNIKRFSCIFACDHEGDNPSNLLTINKQIDVRSCMNTTQNTKHHSETVLGHYPPPGHYLFDIKLI